MTAMITGDSLTATMVIVEFDSQSCRFGFWAERKGGHVRLMLPERGAAAKERP